MTMQERAYRRQKALYFEATGVDEFGQDTVADPIEIVVRWNWVVKSMTGPEGTPVRVDATVVTDRELTVGSTMVESSLENWYGTGSPVGEHTLMEIVAVNITKDIKARNTLYTVGLAYFKETSASETP